MPPPASMSDTISGFDPRSVTGCQLWLDASDTSTLTGSSPVTSWRNKIVPSNNTPVFATSGGSPSISATAINGKPAMYFNGSSYFTGAISGANTTTITVFIVGSLISPFGGFSGLLCFGNPSQLDYDNVGSLPITMYNDQFKIYGARNSSSQPTPILANVPFLYVLQYDGAFINTWLNGTQQTDPSINIASSGTFTYTNYSVAARAGTISGQYTWSGYFGEILVYQSAVNTTDRQQIEGYLGWKWGLQTNSSSFIPTSITGCQLWLDGADRESTSMNLTGTSVTLWKDKAGVSTTTLGGTAPTLSTSGPSGVFFPGTGYFTTTYTASPVNETLFIVFNTTTALYTAYNPIIGSSATGGRSYSLQNGSPILGYLSESIAWGAITSFVIGTITLAEGTYTGTTESVTVNGGAFVTTTQSFTAGRVSHIGASSSGSYFFKGTLYEIIAYNFVLSTTQRQQVEAYLARKWSVSVPTQVLPIKHSSYLTRPFSRRFNVVDLTVTPEYWFDAADINTIAVSGNFLTTWTNKGSFTGSNITPTTANTATSGTTRFNGNNLISIPSANRLQYTGYFPNNSRARFFVTRQTAAGNVIYLYQGYNSINGYDYVAIEANTILEVAQGNVVTLQSSAISSLNGVVSLLTIQNSATSQANNRVALNGSNVTLTTNSGASAYFTGSVTTYIGNTNAIGQDFGEFLSFNMELSLPQIYQIEGYLAYKWGLQASLPVTHPYYKFLPSSAIPFLPTNLSGCTVWLDAVDPNGTGAQPTNGSTISTWVDKSGNSKNMTIYAGTPVFNINPSRITFNGSTSLINSTFTSQIFTLFIVYLQTTATAPVFATSSTLEYTGFWPNEGGTVYFDRGGNNWYTQASTFPVDTRRILVIQYTANGTGASMFVWSDGTLSISTTSLGARTVTALLLGSRPSTSAFLTGNYNEVIQYDSVLTTVQRQKVEGYLASKWGLTSSLPTIHPYRQFEPVQESYIPVVAPGTPVSLVASNTGSTFNMSWTTGSGGTPVTYTVTVYAGASLVATQTITHPTISSTYSPMTVSVAYTFYVSATNTGGTSALAGPSSSVTYTAGATYTFSATLLGFPATTGYTRYSGSFTSIDDGYSSTPLTLPVAFSTNAQSSSLLYMSTNGFFTLGSGSGSIVSSPQQSANPAFMAGNPGDNWIQSGLVNSDGDTQNWWYQTGSSGGKSFVKNLVLCGTYGNSTFAKSYIDNFYRDSTYQWYETRVKSNTAGSTGPYNAASVVQPASTTSKVWRGDLNGQNWVYLGAGSVV